MMEGLKQLVMAVAAGAIFASVAASFFDDKSPVGKLIHLMAGLALTLIVTQAAFHVRLEDFSDILAVYRQDGAYAAAQGEELAQEAMGDIIKSSTEAYILDKAESYGAELTVEVTLDEENLPAQVQIQGPVSPHAKSRLRKIMEDDLAIAKENQHWIG